MILLWTDALIFLLVFIIITLAFYMRSREHLRRPWKKIARSKIAMVSLVILMFFVIVGLLDSLHFRPSNSQSNEIISVLDLLAAPVREHQEMT